MFLYETNYIKKGICMIELDTIHQKFTSDIDSVVKWSHELYQQYFSSYFEESQQIFKKLESKDSPIADKDLSWILMTLPLRLIDASEALSNFKISQGVVKLSIKKEEYDLSQEPSELTKAKQQEGIKMLESKLILSIYTSIIAQVENNISFSRELIMSAKKIWDSRRLTDKMHPTSEQNLPEYTLKQSKKEYITGSE